MTGSRSHLAQMNLNDYGNFICSSVCHAERSGESRMVEELGEKARESRLARHDDPKRSSEMASKQRRLWLVAIFLFASLLAVPTARAHEARPAYLEIKETRLTNSAYVAHAGSRGHAPAGCPNHAWRCEEPERTCRARTGGFAPRTAMDRRRSEWAGRQANPVHRSSSDDH